MPNFGNVKTDTYMEVLDRLSEQEHACIQLGLVRSPGFEPGSSAWEADVLARLDYDRKSITTSKPIAEPI